MNGSNIYAGAALNRVAERREDSRWLRARRLAPESRFWLMHGDRHLVYGGLDRPAPVEGRILSDLLEGALELVLLGVAEDGIAEFALALETATVQALAARLGGSLAPVDLRALGPTLPAALAGRLAYARAILGWHARHRFCAACGQPSRPEAAGHRRRCTAPGCAAAHFPRVDPAVIMLVENGDHCLLGRQRQWPAGMHSVLAGFVEPGESLEEAVAREVWEETGVSVDRIRYHSSQPWPFPGSLMLGFVASALTGKLSLRDGELEAVRWYRREELLNSPEDERFRLPRRDSLARRLLADWLASGS